MRAVRGSRVSFRLERRRRHRGARTHQNPHPPPLGLRLEPPLTTTHQPPPVTHPPPPSSPPPAVARPNRPPPLSSPPPSRGPTDTTTDVRRVLGPHARGPVARRGRVPGGRHARAAGVGGEHRGLVAARDQPAQAQAVRDRSSTPFCPEERPGSDARAVDHFTHGAINARAVVVVHTARSCLTCVPRRLLGVGSRRS